MTDDVSSPTAPDLLAQEPEPAIELRVGDKVRFYGEKRAYTVQAVSSDGRWAAATKPFNVQNTVLYTVIDMLDRVRGRDDCYGLGYEDREECENAIGMFERGEAEHSRRFPPIALEVVEIVRCGDPSGPCASTEVAS